MQTCINVLVQIYTSAYFDIGLFTKALEITWAKHMYMKYIFLCEGGMHLLITGFARIGYLHGKGRLGIWVCLQFVIVVFPDHTRLLFYVTAVGSVKQKLSGKECDKALRALSWVSYHALPLLTVLLGWLWQFLVVLTYFLN